ncbi:hypothetical protein LSAT2_005793 [Lamellibrachia satsuma]|nr:hypothetical protein LSAT2_005793 [Lamellibrachia satsuma]
MESPSDRPKHENEPTETLLLRSRDSVYPEEDAEEDTEEDAEDGTEEDAEEDKKSTEEDTSQLMQKEHRAKDGEMFDGTTTGDRMSDCTTTGGTAACSSMAHRGSRRATPATPRLAEHLPMILIG